MNLIVLSIMAKSKFSLFLTPWTHNSRVSVLKCAIDATRGNCHAAWLKTSSWTTSLWVSQTWRWCRGDKSCGGPAVCRRTVCTPGSNPSITAWRAVRTPGGKVKYWGLSVTGTHVPRPTRANGWQPLAECASLALSFYFFIVVGEKSAQSAAFLQHKQLRQSSEAVYPLSMRSHPSSASSLQFIQSPDVWSLSLTEVHTERREGLGFTSEQPYISSSCFCSLLYNLQCNLLFA